MSCGERLSWKELIPVFSFFALRGRCITCGSRISHQYWVVELITATLFVLVWITGVTIYDTFFALILVSLLMVIAVYDIRHTIIPNKVVYAFIVLALFANAPALSTASISEISLHFLWAALSGVVVALPLFALWFISRGTWMGFGDVKLTLGFGLIVGVYHGLMAIMLAFIVGAGVGILLLYAPKVIKRMSLSSTSSRFTMSSEIPFAPFLIIGFLLVYLFQVDLLALIGAFI
jgi:prepilin signal peptidase PulO-like enzyme (type II secretory pathway)